MPNLPANLPETAEAAFDIIGKVTKPGLDDLKLMVLLEASGQGFYAALAEAAGHPTIKALLARNAQEELGHAHRVSKAIKLLYGEEFPVPAPADNPYYKPPHGMAPTKKLLSDFAQGEFGGEMLYEAWASGLGHAQAAELLRLNAREERTHGERDQEAAALLDA